MQKKIKIVIKKLVSLLVLFLITINIFEIVYRYYGIDFYKNSFLSLNTKESLNTSKVDFLVFGDSFSASPDGYVSVLKNNFPSKKIINLSVSGIGIKQVNLYAKNKIKMFNPDVILYQVYVGNDLIDIKNLSNWNELALVRNSYWSISNYYLSLRYLNQNFSFIRRKQLDVDLSLNSKFSIQFYNQREKILLKADANYIEKSITIIEDFEFRYQKWQTEMQIFLDNIPKTKKVYVVFIPHCSQVNEFYYSNTIQIGANFSSQKNIINSKYTFFDRAKLNFQNYDNVIFLNPIDFLVDKDNENYRLYYENDPHFNTNGHFQFANYISKFVIQ